MLLNFKTVQAVTRGADRVEEQDGYVHFFRFTDSQMNVYRSCGNTDFYNKTYATSGVRLAFRTDSRTLSFDFCRALKGSSRSFFAFDLYQDRHMTAHVPFFGEEVREGHLEFSLSAGEKEVELYLPWSTTVALKNVKLDDGATCTPVRRRYSMICFGDSITHGYDAEYPSLTYACRLARLLDADEINKGIGGEVFRPELLQEADAQTPDLVTVAYGTNDWWNRSPEVLCAHAEAFYKRLSELYPNAKIFAITPICRMDANQKTAFGAPCTEVDALLREACHDLPNVTAIKGWSLTPAVKEFYADAYLHPNDLGFGIYAETLYREISAYI